MLFHARITSWFRLVKPQKGEPLLCKGMVIKINGKEKETRGKEKNT